jgi:hypothetical protein
LPDSGGAFLVESDASDLDLLRTHLDAAFYHERYPDVRETGIEPALHYLDHGWREGRDPHPLFSTVFYLDCHPDVRRSGGNPFLHFLREGWLEGRPGAPEALSLASRERLREAPETPLGRRSLALPHGNVLPSAAESGHTAATSGIVGHVRAANLPRGNVSRVSTVIAKARKLLRFALPGRRDRGYIRKVRASGLFDADFYTTHHPGMRWLFRAFPIRHYVTIGEREHLRPNPDFSGPIYLHYNADVRHAGIPPFLHYVEIGHSELRVTKELPEAGPTLARAMPKFGGAQAANADLAIVVHVFYHDLWPEIADRLAASGIAFDLFVTITDKGKETDALLAAIAERFPRAVCLRYPNRGRDVLPFVHLVNAGALDGYRAVCKIHTKRSPHREDGDHWRRHLIGGILPEGRTDALLSRFLAMPDAAIWVADGQHYRSAEWWGSNHATVARVLARLEIRPEGDLSFPAGSMYWLKPSMVATIKAMLLTPEEFESEAAQLDGTLAHGFERALGFVVAAGALRVVETGEIPETPPAPKPATRPAFVSAFYLPQFHPIAENDAWWGKGFTEWVSVTRAKPNFAGHVQPFLPGELGFYDLRVAEVMGEQWRLASGAGIDAFCVYHYWFDGRRVLEKPLEALLARPDLPFRYYLCWANEAWRRNWDGLSGEILLDQPYGTGFEAALVASTLPHFADPRYARPDGTRPRFIVYRPTDMPDPARSIARLRAAWAEAGHPEVELGAVLFHVEGASKVDPALFDFWVEMPPHGLVSGADFLAGGPTPAPADLALPHDFEGLIYDYDRVIAASLRRRFEPGLENRVITGVMPSWDNTARRRRAAHIAHGANPLRFAKWLRGVSETRLATSYRNELFVNAWNEWAEKAVLEPSSQHGRAYLDALAALRG